MRIFANKSFIFSNGEDEVKVRNLDFADVPDWVAKTRLFKLAVGDKSIQVVESTKEQTQIENDGDIDVDIDKNKGKDKKDKDENKNFTTLEHKLQDKNQNIYNFTFNQ